MATYIIGYDLNKEGAAYSEANERLIKRVMEMFPAYWHHLDSTWIVVSELSAVAIRDDLYRYIDENDEILVALLGRTAAWAGFEDDGSQWLKDHL